MKNICVYCGSSPGKSKAFVESAKALGKELVKRDIGLIYGGASVGVMGEVADAVLSEGGKVTGIIPQFFVDKEVAHHELTDLIIVSSMHERKTLMAEMSDGFIALPGGYGTIEEIFEILTWSQLGFHQKPCSLLNIEGYYNDLISFVDNTVEQQFVKDVHRSMLLVESTPNKLLDLMTTYQAPSVKKWLGEGET